MEAELGSFTATTQILQNLNTKYKYLDNIYNLTRDMEAVVISGDVRAFGKLLDMRGDLIIMVDDIDQANFDIARRLPSPLRERIEGILMPKKDYSGETMTLENPLETNIYDTNKRISTLLGKIIKLDQEINHKVNASKRSSSRPIIRA